MYECLNCRTENKKRGKHRAHHCLRSIVGSTAETMCGCPCNQPTSRFQPPAMALDQMMATR